VSVIQRGVAETVLESETATEIAKEMVNTVAAEAAKEIRYMEAVGISIPKIEIGTEIGIEIVIEIDIVIGNNEIGEAHQTIIEIETGLGRETAVARKTSIKDELVDQSITSQIPKNVISEGIIAVRTIGRERRLEKRRAWPTKSCVKHPKNDEP